jgi:hypothetical protein
MSGVFSTRVHVGQWSHDDGDYDWNKRLIVMTYFFFIRVVYCKRMNKTKTVDMIIVFALALLYTHNEKEK